MHETLARVCCTSCLHQNGELLSDELKNRVVWLFNQLFMSQNIKGCAPCTARKKVLRRITIQQNQLCESWCARFSCTRGSPAGFGRFAWHLAVFFLKRHLAAFQTGRTFYSQKNTEGARRTRVAELILNASLDEQNHHGKINYPRRDVNACTILLRQV
jgi:hypothetical protein